MFIPDLQSRSSKRSRIQVLCVGWLDADHPFTTGTTHSDLLDRVFEMCQHPPIAAGGSFRRPFCLDPPFFTSEERHGEKISLGSCAIFVKGRKNKIYEAPDLIYHYMATHRYSPPMEFLKALPDMDPTRQQELFDTIMEDNKR